MNSTLLKVAVAATLTGFAAPAFADDCGEVTITEMNWASSIVVTNVAKFLMEQGYGCTVKAVPSSTVPAMTSVSENGTPDIVTEMWINGSNIYDKLSDEGKIVTLTDVLSDGGIEGWWIPDYLAEAHPELTTIEGVLANPELVGGRFHQCPEGWGCQRINKSLAEAWDLEGNGIEVFQHGSGETLATAIASAYANEEPWFGYYWAPTSILGKYPMVSVDLGPYDAEIHSCNANPECMEVGKSSFPVGPVKTVVTTTFSEEQPEITELMTKMSFTNDQMNSVLAWQEENTASGEETAVYFLTNYSDVWSGWISDDAKEKLGALIK